MLSLYRAWLQSAPQLYAPPWARPQPPPGLPRPVPRHATPLQPPCLEPPSYAPPFPAPPSIGSESELDVEETSSDAPIEGSAPVATSVVDVACCDGPVRFHRVLNEAWNGQEAQGGPEPAPLSCPQCSHAFKSARCFRKHAARHLPPRAQYYPCKSCGGRFPSYYFVHKHRRQCHAAEEAPRARRPPATAPAPPATAPAPPEPAPPAAT